MPLRGEAKRVYQREYMRRRRDGGSRGGLTGLTLEKGNMRPGQIIGMNTSRMLSYILHLNARGLTLTSVPPYRLVDIATGEIKEDGEIYAIR